ncbi:MAG: spermidine synthase [Deltaproteobacteria bacterium]|nr:spermidine synthase [Deltaproteobacteria bacterium]
MMRPWKTIDTAQTDGGTMTLLCRGEGDFLIKLNNYVLMNSRLHLTEKALAMNGLEHLENARARVLIGGLGMGYTLRGALDSLGSKAEIVVAELNRVVVRWCRGPLKELTDAALEDPRVVLEIADVGNLIKNASRKSRKYDAILLDLYQGTHGALKDPRHPFFGLSALETSRLALSKSGVLAVWTEESDVSFEKRLAKAGFGVRKIRPGKGGPRHVVYVATRD